MPEHSRWLSLISVALLSGCQTTENATFSWFPFKQDRAQESAEFAAKSQPLASVTAVPELDEQSAKPPKSQKADGPAVASARLDQLIDQGVKALGDDRREEAETAFRSVLESVPDHATAHHGLAMLADKSRNWSEAEYHYKQALRSQPRHDGLLNDLGYSYLLQNRFYEASLYLDQAVAINPRHEKAHENLAMLALRQGKRAEAETRLRQVYSADDAGIRLVRLESQVQSTDSLAASQQPAQPVSSATASSTAAAPGVSAALPTGPVASSGAMSAASRLQANATLEEVQAIAARERMLAEQERQKRAQSMVERRPDYTAENLPQQASPVADPRSLAGVPTGNPPVTAQWPGNSAQYPASPASHSAPVTAMPMQAAESQPQNYGTGLPQSGALYGQRPQETGNIIPVGGSGAFSATAPQSVPTNMAPAGNASGGAGSDALRNFPLAGLNAGPGALFPVSPGMPSQGMPSQAGYQQNGSPQNLVNGANPAMVPGAIPAGWNSPPASHQNPAAASNGSSTLSDPVSGMYAVPSAALPPTSSGVITATNGAMFPPPQNVLPAQQWAQQQAMNAQQYQAPAAPAMPTVIPGTQSPQQPRAFAAAPSPGGPSPQAQTGWPVQQPFQHPASGTGNSSGPNVVAPDPLTQYEQQLKNLENGYNQTLQQMNRASGTPIPAVQAQY